MKRSRLALTALLAATASMLFVAGPAEKGGAGEIDRPSHTYCPADDFCQPLGYAWSMFPPQRQPHSGPVGGEFGLPEPLSAPEPEMAEPDSMVADCRGPVKCDCEYYDCDEYVYDEFGCEGYDCDRYGCDDYCPADDNLIEVVANESHSQGTALALKINEENDGLGDDPLPLPPPAEVAEVNVWGELDASDCHSVPGQACGPYGCLPYFDKHSHELDADEEVAAAEAQTGVVDATVKLWRGVRETAASVANTLRRWGGEHADSAVEESSHEPWPLPGEDIEDGQPQYHVPYYPLEDDYGFDVE